MAQYKENEFDVIVIGGGITGAGTARDCSKDGIPTRRRECNSTGAVAGFRWFSVDFRNLVSWLLYLSAGNACNPMEHVLSI